MKIECKKITGFRVLDSNPVTITDFRGVPFYDTSVLKKRVKKFNLPKGSYNLVTGNIEPLSKPVNYPLMKMPLPERYYPNPRNFKLLFSVNRNKASVNWGSKDIILDNEFKTAPLPKLYFVLFHEYGHQYYKTEALCDLYAANMMLRRGFNPSQVGEAQINTLSNCSPKREFFLIKKIINNGTSN